ncbi:MAG: EscU/YscU/HrcU family type III secretion system export apparatus switch protein [Polyangiaceae bacterium]
MSEPTEDATPRRLERARREGDGGASLFASRAAGIFAAIALLPAAAAATMSWFGTAMRAAIAEGPHPTLFPIDMNALGRDLLGLTAPLLLATAATTAIATFLQTGGVFAVSRAALRFERLNPFSGGRLFSAASAFATVRAMVYGFGAFLVVFFEIRAHALDVAHLAGHPEKIGRFVLAMTSRTWENIAFLGIGIAAVDVVVTRVLWSRRLRMTKEEVLRERRESHGDPQIKAARERAFEQLLAGAANLDEATLVVTDGRRAACAIRYVAGTDAAPVVIAIGAELEPKARARGIPTAVDRDLAGEMTALDIGRPIPERLYDAVADLLADLKNS